MLGQKLPLLRLFAALIISNYWKDNAVPKSFIDTFEKEYIKKNVQWHYGAAFAGKSRTNNSLESGNNVLKLFFNRKQHNLKEFFGKMREFVQQWSTSEKTSFPYQVNYSTHSLKEAKERAKQENFLKVIETPHLLYYPRKGISTNTLTLALQKLRKRYYSQRH